MGIGTMNQTTARPAVTVPAPLTIDFDTRLMLAAIGMDAILKHRHGDALKEAHAAVTAARTEADRYGAEALALGGLLDAQGPGTFRSHPILKRAGDIIRGRGWHQGSWNDERGAVCALAAIRLATGGDSSAEADAVTVLLERIRSDLGHDSLSVPGWNDSRRSASQVLALLF